LGGDFQALPAWRVGGSVASSSSADFEPGREFSVNAAHSWRNGWGTAVQWRRRDYLTAAVSSYSVTGDKYIADYRFAYTVNYSRLHGAGSSLGHTATLGWYPSEQRGMALAFGTGEEIETIGLNRLLRTDVSTVTLSGRNTVATRFTLNWWLGTHRQGDFYRRHNAGLAVRFGL
jgi:YaiO family outer membrane protein